MTRSFARDIDRRTGRLVFRTLVGIFALGLVAVGVGHAKDPTTVAVLKRVEAKSQAVAAKALGATVGIINQSLAGNGRLGEGSGVVVSEDGLILTVGHVIAKPGAELTVIFPDGRRAPAKALGANFGRDSGMAKITEPGKWPHVEIGRSDDIRPGAWCMALGHPGGIQKGRTPPIRLGRILNAGKGSKFLVSDATVISGDSGGPLFDLDGRVIGIHSNIGTNVNQNQHVPIDAYREQWNDLLASKTFGSAGDLQRRHAGVSPEKIKRFQELFFQRLMAGDQEAKDLVKDGRMQLTPADIERLLAKWEKPSPAAGDAAGSAAKPLDFLKFQRLFQDRLIAGDPDVLGLIKEGKMMVAPQQMHQLMDQWEKKSQPAGAAKPKEADAAKAPDKKPSDAPAAPENKPSAGSLERLRQLMGGMRSPGGQPSPGAAPLGSFGNWMAMNAATYGKSSPKLLREIAPVASEAARSTVVILCDGKPAVLGTVVRKDGYIVTKASDLQGKLSCKIGLRQLDATLVKSKPELDLALLKVSATDLEPVAWAGANPPVPGSWLITPGAEKDALGLGVMSISAREIPDAPRILLRNRAVVGVLLDPEAKNARIRELTPGLPGAKAGLKAGDVIVSVGGTKTPEMKDVNQVLGKFKPGDKLPLAITRDGKPMTVTVELASSDQMAPKSSSEQVKRLSAAGGTMSKRHSPLTLAFTHDTVLQAAECGGPIVDLDGKAVGVNIARADRTASYAIPAATVRKVVAELLPAK